MPLSPDDFPIIGRTKMFSNLYLNVGHGFRGDNYKSKNHIEKKSEIKIRNIFRA